MKYGYEFDKEYESVLVDFNIEVVKATFEDTVNNLRNYGKCLMLRFPNFGKTFSLARLTRLYNKPLLIYPKSDIRDEYTSVYKDVVNKKTHGYSYGVFSNNCDNIEWLDNLIAEGFDLIIFEEAHRTGGVKVKRALNYVLPKLVESGCHIVGASVSDIRTVGSSDFVSEIFDDITCFEYDLEQGVTDKVTSLPYWEYFIYETKDSMNEIQEDLKELQRLNSLCNLSTDMQYAKQLNDAEIALSNSINIPKIIKDKIDAVRPNEKYYKFMIFFSRIDIIKDIIEDREEIQNWFRKSFPEFKIRILIVTSAKEHRGNEKKLEEIKYSEGVIDLICCINMLNLGNKMEDLTGVIFLRQTSSFIVQQHQAGKCIKMNPDKKMIIFDCVSNLFLDYRFNATESMPSDSSKGTHDIAVNRHSLIAKSEQAEIYDIFIRLKRTITEEGKQRIIYLYTEYFNGGIPLTKIASYIGQRKSKVKEILVEAGYMNDDGSRRYY